MHGTKLALEIYLIGLVGTARKSIVICAHVSADYRLCYLVPVAWMFWVNHEKIVNAQDIMTMRNKTFA